MFKDFLLEQGPVPPSVLLVHGEGGSGKTEAVRRLDRLGPILSKWLFKTAFNNINAVSFGGRTMASVLSLDVEHDCDRVCPPPPTRLWN